MRVFISCAFCGARGRKYLTVQAKDQIVHCNNCNYLDNKNPMFITATALKLKARAKVLLAKPVRPLDDYASTIPFIKQMREEDSHFATEKHLQALRRLDTE